MSPNQDGGGDPAGPRRGARGVGAEPSGPSSSERGTSAARSPLRRPGRAALGLLVGLIALELALQALALGGRLLRESRGTTRGTGAELVVLCVGDSNTYGLNVDPDGTYPANLEALLRAADIDARVVNRGLPGKNTRTMVDELDEYLEMYEPDLVLILGGLNNRWSGLTEEETDPAWYESLRTWKLYRIVRARVVGSPPQPTRIIAGDHTAEISDAPLEVATGPRTSELKMLTREGDAESFTMERGGSDIEDSVVQDRDGALERLVNDLLLLATMCEEGGARPVLLNYGAEWKRSIGLANEAARKAAEGSELVFVDVGNSMRGVVADHPRDDLFFRDGHPRRIGYQIIARLVFDALAENGVVDATPLGDPLSPLRERGELEARLEVVSDDGPLVLECSYEPGLSFNVLLARAQTPQLEALGGQVPLARDELFERSFLAEDLAGTFDAAPSVRIEIPARFLSGEEPVFAALLVRPRGFGLVAVSESIRVR